MIKFLWNLVFVTYSTITSQSKPLHSILSCIFTLMIFTLLSYSADQLSAESCIKSGDLVKYTFNYLWSPTLISSLADQCISSVMNYSLVIHSTILSIYSLLANYSSVLHAITLSVTSSTLIIYPVLSPLDLVKYIFNYLWSSTLISSLADQCITSVVNYSLVLEINHQTSLESS